MATREQTDDARPALTAVARPKSITVRTGFSAASMLGVGAFYYPVVADTGMGSLLTSRFTGTLDNQFTVVLLSRLDTGTMGLEFRDGQIRIIDLHAVSKILGFKSGLKGRDVA
jgi:hypothetical protein